MRTFEVDRELIIALSDQDAKSVLELLDGGVTHDEAPSEFRAALAAVRRSPDVSRYFLVRKTQKHDDEESHRGTGVE